MESNHARAERCGLLLTVKNALVPAPLGLTRGLAGEGQFGDMCLAYALEQQAQGSTQVQHGKLSGLAGGRAVPCRPSLAATRCPQRTSSSGPA